MRRIRAFIATIVRQADRPAPFREPDGRFVSVERAKIRARTAWLREQIGLEPSPHLENNRIET